MDFDRVAGERSELSAQMVDVIQALGALNDRLYHVAIIPALRTVVCALPMVSPITGRPLHWPELRPLVVSVIDLLSARVVAVPPARAVVDWTTDAMFRGDLCCPTVTFYLLCVCVNT
jgi:hypothetical protein